MAPLSSTDQIANATLYPFLQPVMTDETPELDKVRIRRQPPVPLTLALFLASVVGFIIVVTGLFALLRYIGGH